MGSESMKMVKGFGLFPRMVKTLNIQGAESDHQIVVVAIENVILVVPCHRKEK